MRSWPQYDEARWKKMNDAYYKAFPGVLYYQDYCYRLAMMYSHAVNLFGVRYYNVSGHDLINMLIQGTGATLLKLKIRLIYDYIKTHKIKSRMQMDIHDEISWERHEGDDYHVFMKFKQMMEDWEDAMVPLVAEMSYTTTTWAQKKAVKGAEDFEEKIHTCA
jgi:DNA polymerase I-like protein with 3'-5' exonuclease and polymerase domains